MMQDLALQDNTFSREDGSRACCTTGKEVLQGFDHAFACGASCGKSALPGDMFLDRWKRISRAGDLARDALVEHGDVIVIVSCRENTTGIKLKQSSQLCQSRSFAVSGVSESQVDAIALVADVWKLLLVGVDGGADRIEFLVGFCHDSKLARVASDEFRTGLRLDHLLDRIDGALMIANETFVGASGKFVPRAVVLPSCEDARFVDVALLSDDEIRLHEKAVLGESLQRLTEAASGVDDPSGTLTPEVLDHFRESGMERGIGLRVHEGAVEVKAENETGLGGRHGTCTQVPKEVGCNTSMTCQAMAAKMHHKTTS